MPEEEQCRQAEKTALRLIARAEQCSGGLSRKMEKRGYDSACIRNVIARLFELNLLDDRRYARMWLQSRLHFTRSPKRLLASLCAKGIDRDDGEAALNEVLCEETEFSLLIRYVKKRAKKTSGDLRFAGKNNSSVTRNVKFLLKSEGFSSAVIQKFLDEE